MQNPNLDPEIAKLGSVKMETWKLVVGAVAWLTTLSAMTAANTKAIASKADREIVEVTRRMQIENLAERQGDLKERVIDLERQLAETRRLLEGVRREHNLQGHRVNSEGEGEGRAPVARK